MINNALHITNGNVLTNYLRELDFTEDILTWQEMLCEGPTIPKIDSEEFFKLRADFLNTTYDIDVDHKELQKELSLLDHTDNYTEINLWFEYDLFCHINMLGVINLLHQKKIDKPLYLICSGRIKGEKNLKALGELTPNQLKSHYKNKILLTKEDIEMVIALWRTYCGKDHNIFKPYIVKNSSFKYQGYYGYGDMQLKRKIKELSFFFDKTENGLELNRKGHDALLKQYNFAKEVNNNMTYGGVKRLDFQFNEDQNKLIKTIT